MPTNLDCEVRVEEGTRVVRFKNTTNNVVTNYVSFDSEYEEEGQTKYVVGTNAEFPQGISEVYNFYTEEAVEITDIVTENTLHDKMFYLSIPNWVDDGNGGKYAIVLGETDLRDE